jgi:hypothetical protein
MSRYTFRVASSFEDDAPRRTAPPRREDRTDVDASAGEERTRRATHAREEEEVEVARAPPRGQATAGTATADITSSVLQHDGGARRVCRMMRLVSRNKGRCFKSRDATARHFWPNKAIISRIRACDILVLTSSLRNHR